MEHDCGIGKIVVDIWLCGDNTDRRLNNANGFLSPQDLS